MTGSALDGQLGGRKPVISDGGITVWLREDGIMHVKLPDNAAIAGRHAAAAAETVRVVAAGNRYPLLLDVAQVKSVSRNARRVYGHPDTVTAYALLGNGPVDRVLSHYFLGAGPPHVPAQFFESEDQAVQWLGAYVEGS